MTPVKKSSKKLPSRLDESFQEFPEFSFPLESKQVQTPDSPDITQGRKLRSKFKKPCTPKNTEPIPKKIGRQSFTPFHTLSPNDKTQLNRHRSKVETLYCNEDEIRKLCDENSDKSEMVVTLKSGADDQRDIITFRRVLPDKNITQVITVSKHDDPKKRAILIHTISTRQNGDVVFMRKCLRNEDWDGVTDSELKQCKEIKYTKEDIVGPGGKLPLPGTWVTFWYDLPLRDQSGQLITNCGWLDSDGKITYRDIRKTGFGRGHVVGVYPAFAAVANRHGWSDREAAEGMTALVSDIDQFYVKIFMFFLTILLVILKFFYV